MAEVAPRIPTIGLVGAIGAGKSEVARILAEAGCAVSDADALARQAIEEPAARAALRGWWGERVFGADGSVDRAAVAAIVFADSAERQRLEALLHPRIHALREAAFARAGAVPARVIDAPLLLEAGLDRQCDAILLVDAPRAVRLERLQKGRGWSEAELDRREAAQWPLDRKRARADHVVTNAADRAALRTQVLRTLAEIREAAAT